MADLRSPLEPGFIPALVLGPHGLPRSAWMLFTRASLQGRGTHECAQLVSNSLRSANALKGAACFATVLPSPTKKQPPNPNSKLPARGAQPTSITGLESQTA